MAREPIPLTIPDLSRFAKALRAALERPTGHQSMLNAIARAAGYRNFQHLKADACAGDATPANRRDVERALAWFDAEGRLAGWPGRYKIQTLCMWAVWAQLPDRQALSERDVSTLIDALTLFRDAAQIRRALVDAGLLRRSADGSDYRRVGERPGATERAVMAAVSQRARGRAARGRRPLTTAARRRRSPLDA